MRHINLGCGPYKIDGSINIDVNPLWKPDVVRDVARGLPFDDGSVGRVTTSHFLEHISHETFMFLVREIHRVLTKEGQWAIAVPLGNTGDLEHQKLFREDSFDILGRDEAMIHFGTPKWRLGAKSYHDGRGFTELRLTLNKCSP